MLELIPELSGDFVHQKLVEDSQATKRLCMGLEEKEFKLISFSDDGTCQLVLYKRHYRAEVRQESGIIYLPASADSNPLDFPWQMLRIFTDVKTLGSDVGWQNVTDHYRMLAVQKHFYILQD